jgi:hypothetical protein
MHNREPHPCRGRDYSWHEGELAIMESDYGDGAARHACAAALPVPQARMTLQGLHAHVPRLSPKAHDRASRPNSSLTSFTISRSSVCTE